MVFCPDAELARHSNRVSLQSIHETGRSGDLKDALALPAEARAALAGSLLDSLDTEVD
jgi:hypothetical protein